MTSGSWGSSGRSSVRLHFGRDGNCTSRSANKRLRRRRALDTFQKVLRTNPDGTIPEDNPFIHQATGKYRAIWALGLRNPFTFAVRPATGELLINDVGGKFEEINRGVAGANYGWPAIEHGPTQDSRFRGPAFSYPQASIAGGDFCPSTSAWPQSWRGRYFFADFVHGWIKSLDPDQPEQADNFASGLSRPVDLRFDASGKLFVLLRNAWVIDDRFQPGTSALLEITYSGNPGD
jgi:glucose/arabinose dehydrogenase